MKDHIEYYRKVIVQIATPYCTGTGFFYGNANLIITNEHIIRDNKTVVIEGELFKRQLARIIYTDPKFDLAFIEVPPLSDPPDFTIISQSEVNQGDAVIAIGNPFGLKFNTTQGIISNTDHLITDIKYYLHDAALNPGNSGGPLINPTGALIGINTFIVKDGENLGLALPVQYLEKTINAFQKEGRKISARCDSCLIIVTEETSEQGYCPNCGAKVQLPTDADEYEPLGVSKTIEKIIEKADHEVALSRRGPNNWEIIEGSAKVTISYYEKTGLITGDAYLCTLPQKNIKPLYEYLLRLNHEIEGLTFSIKGQDIMLSLLIYDRYLNADTGLELFKHLFEKADYYDNILVEEYGAQWKNEEITTL